MIRRRPSELSVTAERPNEGLNRGETGRKDGMLKYELCL